MAKIKANDQVKVMSGKDHGKTGKVLQVLPQRQQVVIEGVNVMFKHLRPRRRGEKGQRVQFNGPISISNIRLLCPKCGRATRVGFHLSPEKKRTRVCRKCQEAIE